MGAIDRNRLERTTVPVRPFDGVVEKDDLPTPNLIKVDIIGEEINLLEGAEKTLSDPELRVGYLEVHPVGLENVIRVTTILSNE